MRQDVSALRISPSEGDVPAGSALQLKLFAITGNGGTDLVFGNLAVWASSDVKVAEVNRQGRLTPRGLGPVTVTASFAGQTAIARLQVVARPAGA